MKNVFTFGSNLASIHGAGAAKHAHKNLGAEWGVGEGPTGLCYALPTKDQNIGMMNVAQVRLGVDKFLAYTTEHPELTFQVTRVGCGLAGFADEEIAPMFNDAPDNCEFDAAWQQWLPAKKVWGTF